MTDIVTETNNGAALSVRNLVKQYANADRRVLDDVSFDVPKGRVLVVVGPSGSGKSTLLRTIAGLEPIQGGQIALNGTVIETGKPGSEKAGRSARSSELRTHIGMVFQSYDLFPNKTVLGNIMMAPLLVQKRDKAEVEREALELLGKVGLADRKDAWPHELSGGQRQRASLARGLALKPSLLIADEPTSALDVSVQAKVLELFKRLQAEIGFACLFITHDLAVVDMLADRIMVMHKGKIVEHGDADDIIERPQNPYTQKLLASLPLPDPVKQREHRAKLHDLLAAQR